LAFAADFVRSLLFGELKRMRIVGAIFCLVGCCGLGYQAIQFSRRLNSAIEQQAFGILRYAVRLTPEQAARGSVT